jgi:hypothetical protein
MPKMRFFDNGIIEMDYIDGQEGIEVEGCVNFTSLVYRNMTFHPKRCSKLMGH